MSVAPVATSPGRTACLCALEHTECSLTGCPRNIPPQLHSAGEKVKKHKTKTTLGSPGGRAKGKEERKKGRKRRFAPSHTRFRGQPSRAGRAAPQSLKPPPGMSPCSPGCCPAEAPAPSRPDPPARQLPLVLGDTHSGTSVGGAALPRFCLTT